MRSLPTLNVELLDKTLDQIVSHPEGWDQGSWRKAIEAAGNGRCGTALCFAGWTDELAGGVWAWDPIDILKDGRPQSILLAEVGERDAYRDGGELVISAEDRARNLLGLTHSEAMILFAAGNTMDDLKDIVRGIKAARANGKEYTSHEYDDDYEDDEDYDESPW